MRNWLAVVAWLVTLVLVGAAWLLGVLNGLDLQRFFGEFIAGPIVAALAFGTVGAVIAAHQVANRIGWLLCVVGILAAATSMASEYARYALVTSPGVLPAANFVAWLNIWIWIPQFMLTTTFVPLVFPDGRLPSRRWRPLAWVLVGVVALETITAAITPRADASLPQVVNPYAISGSEHLLGFIAKIGAPLQAAGALVGVVSVVTRYRRAPLEQRQAIKWLGYAAALVVVVLAVPAGLVVFGLDAASMTVLSGVVQTVTIPWLAVAIGIGVLRYHLWDIDVLINRTLVYATLTACVLGVYVGLVGYLGAAVHARGDVVSLIAAAVVAIGFQPLRLRTQRGVNRLLYGRRDEPYAVLADLSRRLEDALAPESVLLTIVETVRDALKVPYVALTLHGESDPTLAVASGTPMETSLRLPLIYQHERVGELALSPRAPTERFAPADRRLLEDIARQAGVAAHAVRLTADLQRSRERIVSAREEERRRLRRDLHD
ncbi:MAG: histidine kinase, partial [Chloroflexi bacterium]|nr:histidine kinase [Chloroflexota bacterium]